MDLTAPACPLDTIGIVRTGRTAPESTPVQSTWNQTEHGVVDIHPQFAEGLSGLDGFDYAWLLTWLHLSPDPAEPVSLTPVPILLRPQRRRMGLFATRSPRRINPIGLSLVRILEVTGRQVRFAGVDLVDGTPVIDLKPYVTRLDRPAGDPRCGWFDTVAIQEGVTPAELGDPTAD
jgi:tRNA-Thr(GGU) m(6)t(6)A37 methyltransferase TsaA